MTKWNSETIRYFQEASPEEKLQILRHEMLTPIHSIQGIEKLLRKMDWEAIKDSSEELNFLLDQLAKDGNHLIEVLDLLTGKSDT